MTFKRGDRVRITGAKMPNSEAFIAKWVGFEANVLTPEGRNGVYLEPIGKRPDGVGSDFHWSPDHLELVVTPDPLDAYIAELTEAHTTAANAASALAEGIRVAKSFK